MSESIPLQLRRENGKSITVNPSADGIALIVWSKAGTPKLPLDLTANEARGLRSLLDAALAKVST